MDTLLRPGMGLMRRLRVASKFGFVFLLLLVPLAISLGLGYLRATDQITAAAREREGLAYAEPLGRLVVQLAEVRQTAAAGGLPGRRALSAAGDVAAADLVLGDAFDVRPQWQRLLVAVRQVSAATATPGDVGLVAADAQNQAIALLSSVGDASGLAVDPQLDTRYVLSALGSRLPRLLEAAATMQERYAATGADAADDIRWQLAADDLRTTTDALDEDLRTAQAASAWTGFAATVQPQLNALKTAVRQYLDLAQAGDGARADLTGVTASVTSTASTLTATMHTLLDQRVQRLGAERTRPMLVTLAALLLAAYLLASLWRATSQDVQHVLADIGGVTSGALNQSEPLPGGDEFAQMSRAMVYARDRLTALLGALRFQATHDELTALGNRALFLEKLADALQPGQPATAVVLVDLDGFKDVNDSFGHGMGDRLLRTVGARLHRAVGRRDVVCRLAGDEFAVLLHDVSTRDEARRRIDGILASLTRTVDVDGRHLHVAASVGFALGEPGETTVVELMRDVDVALNAAKTGPKGAVTAFEPAMREATRERTELSGDLVRALERDDEISLAYQPIVEIESGRILGVEALVRWTHPTRGPVPPSTFVPLAEATGLIVPLGRRVLDEAVRQLALWRREFPDGYPLTMDVNISADQLDDPGLVGEVLSLVDETGIDPGCLVLEITETALVRDLSSALRRLGQVKAMGVRLALDDFGTGYSSLSYLKHLPVDVLKIDRSFVTDLEEHSGEAMMKGIVELGAGLGMQLICEGIETPDQGRRLHAAGCRLGQGFLWSRPQDAEGIRRMLATGVLPPALGLPPTGSPAAGRPGVPGVAGLPGQRGSAAERPKP